MLATPVQHLLAGPKGAYGNQPILVTTFSHVGKTSNKQSA